MPKCWQLYFKKTEMKNISIFRTLTLLGAFCIIPNCSTNNAFYIDGVILGDYDGYLYLNYDNRKDSSLVVNNKFQFKGITSSDITYTAYFSTNRTSAMNENFFIENENIEIQIQIENKKISQTELDWIIVNSISGTKTSLIQKNYKNFTLKHKKDKDWRIKNYRKVDEIISKNPKSQYSEELLSSLVVSDSIIDSQELQKIYRKLDLSSQDPLSMRYLKRLIFPNDTTKIGKPIIDFELPDINNNLISTKQYRGSVLFIDFWATWCAPCKKEFPKILSISNDFKNKKFKVLGVSLDKNKENWIQFLKNNQLKWENIIDKTAFDGNIAQDYDITYVPSNVLVDKKGIVLATNLKSEELRVKLEKLFD